jgi:hypothetical protein
MIRLFIALLIQVSALGCKESCEDQFKARAGLLATKAEVTECAVRSNPHNKYDLRLRARVEGTIPNWTTEVEAKRCTPYVLAREAVADLAPHLTTEEALGRSVCISNSDGYLVVYQESQASFLAMYRAWPQIPADEPHP